MQKQPIEAIRTLVGCGASGASLTAGKVYAVPAQVSDKDARILITVKKAVAITAEEAKALQAKAAKEAAKTAKESAKAAEEIAKANEGASG